MLGDATVVGLRAALQQQHRTLHQLGLLVEDAEARLSGVDRQAAEIAELDALLAELEADAHLLDAADLEDLSSAELDAMLNRRRTAVREAHLRLDFRDWDDLVARSQTRLLQQGHDPLLPYEAFLQPADLQQLRNESYEAKYRWDRWDYAFVGTAGVLAALTDLLLVRIPQSMTYGGVEQSGSPLTAWLKEQGQDGWLGEQLKNLEKTCKVPFDVQSAVFGDSLKRIDGMSPRTHRYQSLGHDPALGVVFGVLDILRGTITGFGYDPSSGLHTPVVGKVFSSLEPLSMQRVIEAVLMWLGHMASDVCTSMGLPAPFLTALQGLNVGSFGPKGRTVAQLGRWMYLNGYDLRHFAVSGIGPLVIELLVRGYIMVRHYWEHGETRIRLANHPKYRSMLLAAHGIAAAGNAGKVALMQGNPLAINQAQWMAFFRYLVPTMKYWVFDRAQMKLEHMEAINEAGWGTLEEATQEMVARVAGLEWEPVVLG